MEEGLADKRDVPLSLSVSVARPERVMDRCACRRGANAFGRALLGGLLMLNAVGAGERDLADLSLEELMNETVTSVSKREQKRVEAAAAIAVLSNGDLRRSGATTIWDAMRTVPGLQVASVSSAMPAVGARGFIGAYADKQLVLVDGRAVYSPFFSGVFWYLQQPILDDVDRVEIIRGPGASIWGANAVNGVINIVSSSARDTQGGLIYAGAGQVHGGMGGVRYGGELSEGTYYRVFASRQVEDAFPAAPGQPAGAGDWQSWHGGFRLDRYTGADAHLTWQADVTRVGLDSNTSDAGNVNMLGRWTRQVASGSSVELQAYVDRTSVHMTPTLDLLSETADLAFQHDLVLQERHDLIWGLGARVIRDRFVETNPMSIIVRRPRAEETLFSGFVQDDFAAIPERLTLTAGVKLEHNDFTGWEVQPTLRALFKASERQTLWAGVSRAIRSPSEAEALDVVALPAGMPFTGPDGGMYLPQIVGNRAAESEVLWSFEAGYRVQPAANVSVDLAVYSNRYTGLFGILDANFVPGEPLGALELPWQNLFKSRTRGAELAVVVAVTSGWRVQAGYTVFHHRQTGPAGADTVFFGKNDSKEHGFVRSSVDFNSRTSLDVQVRAAGGIQAMPGYTTADVRLAYRPSEDVELALVGQNLLDGQHPEQPPGVLAIPAEVPRSIHGKMTWRF